MILMTEAYQSRGNVDLTVTDITQPLNCGELDGTPVCCNISADPDGDGRGIQNTDQICVVTEATKGWYPPNPPDVLAAINVGGAGHHVEADGIYCAPDGYTSFLIFIRNQ
ncbi:MAG: hypothetical protein NVV73_19585 [Cellvibrionaceae bacterium]|nr:hypothetical protein [Cellvibrionaceae bacterium]